MADLAGVLASIPGIAGYEASRQRNEQSQMGQLAQAQGLMALLQQAQQGPLKGALMQGQVQKQQQELEMNRMFQSGAMEKMTPDQLDLLGQKLAMQGHPGAATVMTIADRRRAAAEVPGQLDMLRSKPQGLPPGAVVGNQQTTQAIPPEDVAAFAKVAQAAQQGQTASATPQAGDPQMRGGGVFDPLLESQSPAIASRARQLQALVDNPQFLGDPKRVQQEVDNLTKMDATFQQQKAMAAQRQGNNIEIRNMFPPAAHAAARGAAAPTVGDFSTTGDDFLKSIPESDRNLVKKIANYDIDPKTLSVRGGQRERVLSMVSQFDPTYDDTQYANKRRAIGQFGSGPQGNTVRALNVAIEHIDTLGRAADAMKNGEFTPGNKAYNELAKLVGQTPPNTFEALRDIVANEVVKGTIGAVNTVEDRREAAAKVKASASPAQLKELMNGWTELMGGQVKGLDRQYTGATGLKDFRERYLTDRTKDAIALAEAKAGGGIPEFATEAAAIASGAKGKVKIGGRNATID